MGAGHARDFQRFWIKKFAGMAGSHKAQFHKAADVKALKVTGLSGGVRRARHLLQLMADLNFRLAQAGSE